MRDDGDERDRESQHEEWQLHLRCGGRYVDGSRTGHPLYGAANVPLMVWHSPPLPAGV